MYKMLTEKFLSMKWDKNYLTKIDNSINEDTVVSILDNVFPEWTFRINNIVPMNDNSKCVAITLFMPGRILDGTGSNEWSAICNIISKFNIKVNESTNNMVNLTKKEESSLTNNPNNKPKTTSASVIADIEKKKAEMQKANQEQPNNDTQDIFNDLMGNDTINTNNSETTDTQQESSFIEFGTPEYDKAENEIVEQLKTDILLKNPTAEEVNPNNIITNSMWTRETGEKIKAWMAKHNVTTKDQMSSWFIRYCNLDYDHFNPEWLDKFIAWTDALREQQTY